MPRVRPKSERRPHFAMCSKRGVSAKGKVCTQKGPKTLTNTVLGFLSSIVEWAPKILIKLFRPLYLHWRLLVISALRLRGKPLLPPLLLLLLIRSLFLSSCRCSDLAQPANGEVEQRDEETDADTSDGDQCVGLWSIGDA